MGIEAPQKPPVEEGQPGGTPPVAEQAVATPSIKLVEGETPEDTLEAIAGGTKETRDLGDVLNPVRVELPEPWLDSGKVPTAPTTVSPEAPQA